MRGRKSCVSEKFCGQKNRHKILSHYICILHMLEPYVIHKSKFFKNEPWLIIHDHKWFFRIWKAEMCSFSTRIMMDLSKIYNHSVLYPGNKMAFETPLAPGGLHFSFGPSGVKIIILIHSKVDQNHFIIRWFDFD